jgi:hypothetical protein
VRIHNVHERVLASPPEVVSAFFADDGFWPDPGPKPADGHLRVGVMIWEPVDRPGARLAFRIVAPPELQAEHWFEIVGGDGGTTLRHTVDGTALGTGEELWRDRIEPMHDVYIEALFDRAQEATA